MLIHPGTVIGQPGRIAPVTLDERLTAIHESAHAVFAQIMPDMNDLGKIQLWESQHGVQGFCGPTDSELRPTFDADQDYGLLPIDATMPINWQSAAKDAWTYSLCCFAGSAAQLVQEGEDISAANVRWNPPAIYDMEIAEKILSH